MIVSVFYTHSVKNIPVPEGEDMALADIIKTAMDQIQTISKTETVIGEPIQAGEVILIPVSRLSVGFAAGGGDGGKSEKHGSGAGTEAN